MNGGKFGGLYFAGSQGSSCKSNIAKMKCIRERESTGWYISLSNSASPKKGNSPFEWQAKEFKRITVIVFVVIVVVACLSFFK